MSYPGKEEGWKGVNRCFPKIRSTDITLLCSQNFFSLVFNYFISGRRDLWSADFEFIVLCGWGLI